MKPKVLSTLLVMLTMTSLANAAYDAHLAKSLAYICASTFGT